MPTKPEEEQFRKKVVVFMDDARNEKLKAWCNKHGFTMSSFIRFTIDNLDMGGAEQ